MRRALATAAVLALTLSACGGEGEPSAEQESPSAAPSETPQESTPASPSEQATGDDDSSPDDGNVIEIEIEGQKIEPHGKRVQVPAGEPITFEVESDRAAELHVHSSPEHSIEVEPGESTHEITINRPGVVDVEEHHAGTVVVQLEVR